MYGIHSSLTFKTYELTKAITNKFAITDKFAIKNT